MKKVLVTGAAGHIGTAFAKTAHKRYQLRLGDIETIDSSLGESMPLDIADLDACRSACAGIDTVLHLAAESSPSADFNSVLPANIVGTFNMFTAAREMECDRIVYASSVQVFQGLESELEIPPDRPVRPENIYGVSKCFGEALASSISSTHSINTVVVRVGWFERGRTTQKPDARLMSEWVSHRDLCHLLIQCIEVPFKGFTIAHGVSNNRLKRLDLTTTRTTFNYSPRDDAFEKWSCPDQSENGAAV